MIAVHPSFPAKDYKGFLAELKKNPGKYSYASSGTGGIGHLQMELFKNLSGTFVTHIPYRGAGPALNDTVAGQVPIIFDNLPSALPFIKDGRLIADRRRRAAAPARCCRTCRPSRRSAWSRSTAWRTTASTGRKGMPKEIVDKVHAAVKKTLDDPAVKKRIEDTGSLIIGNTPEQFAAQIAAEFEVYKKVVAAQKLKLE